MTSVVEGLRVITSTTLLHLSNISKTFGATKAVKDVSIKFSSGQIVGLIGENGAGKSTLAKIIAGVYPPNSGTVNFDGSIVNFRSPFEALNSGVAMMAQEIMLIPEATVEANIFLSNLPSNGWLPDNKKMRDEFTKLNILTGFALKPNVKVSSLRLADQQKVEIMRSIARKSKLIIMDEPSASLTADEVQRLHHTIKKLVSRGITVLLISHFLEEVLKLSETVIIMRDGEIVRSGPTSDETVETLVSGMVGRSLETRYSEPESRTSNRVMLKIDGVTNKVLQNISFEIREGEILGLAGLIGSGRTEIARAIYGADRISSGKVTVEEKEISLKSPAEVISSGIYMIPENRKEQGLFLNSSSADNMLISTLKSRSRLGFISKNFLNKIALLLAKNIDLRFHDINQLAASLSGGNQQKLLFGRAIEVSPKILIVDEPTRGVDIAAKRTIHKILIEQAKRGTAILFISSEIEEVLGVCDRVLVVNRGSIQSEFKRPFNQTSVVSAFFGRIGGGKSD
jgi:simple sugar transport system ATP-binding protein/ribose transport system ATP-binding protein